MGRGIIEAQTLRTEQFNFEARTTDPADAQPGECWIRVDQTSTNPDVIAELRRQDNSGVTTCPIFAAAEESNLGTDVTRGPSVVLDDGSVGFIAMTTGDGEVGSPRAVTSAGTQYVSHNALELSPIPDSGATHQWNWTSGTGTVIDDVNGSKDATFNSLTWNTGSGTENTHGTLNGTDEYANLGNDIVTTFLDGSGTLFQWHRIPSGNSSRNAIFASFNSSSGNNVSFMVWNDGTNEYRSSLTIDGSFAQPTAGDPNSQRGDWVAYAMVYDGSAVTTYNAVPPDYTVSQIDSVSLSATSTASTWDNDVSYGRDTGGTDKYYNGDLDIGFADTTAFSSSELQGFVDDTKQFYE